MAEITVVGYRQLQAALKRVAPEIQKDLQREIRKTIAVAAQDARGNAGWSKTIPPSIAVSVTQRGAGVKTRRKVSRVGALYEAGAGRGRPWRHPLFGNRDRWYAQAARPFIRPAVLARRTQLVHDLARLLADAARKAGW